MKYILSLFLFAVSLGLTAQDSVTVVHYNLLNYGNYTGYCNTSNNNHLDKEEYLNTIIGYLRPDILSVNELTDVAYYHDRFLNEVMNHNGRNYYKRTPATNIAGSDIINMLFYDSTKLVLKSTQVLQSYVRDINLYRLYFKTSKLPSGDTIFLNCISAHLKAGSEENNAVARAVMASNTIGWLNQNAERGNYLMLGDFNLYTAAEEAYQTLTSVEAGSFQFFDPVNAPGDWNNNFNFAKYHTQSVSSAGTGCQAGGGMDDRFDFILATDEIIEGSAKVRYKAGSYAPVGQDGRHFNQSITTLPNNTVPQDVLTALGKNSDHLPVKMVLEVEAELPEAIRESIVLKDITLARINESEAVINLTALKPSKANIAVYSMTGQLVSLQTSGLKYGFNSISIPLDTLKHGLYMITVSDQEGYRSTVKLVR